MTSGIGIKIDNVREIDLRTVGVIKSDAVLVAESIHRILNTTPYERPRESVGSRIKEILFEPNDYLTATLGSYYITDAIARYEPRVDIVSLEATASINTNKQIFRIVFRLKSNPQQLFATNVQIQT